MGIGSRFNPRFLKWNKKTCAKVRTEKKKKQKFPTACFSIFFLTAFIITQTLCALHYIQDLSNIISRLQRHDYQCRLFRSQGDVCAAAYSRYPPVSVSSIFKRRKKERQKKTCSPFLSPGDETSSCLLNISVCSVAGAIDKFEKEVARFVSPPFIRIAGNFFSF